MASRHISPLPKKYSKSQPQAECASAVRLLHSSTTVVHLKIAFKWKDATTKGLVTIGSMIALWDYLWQHTQKQSCTRVNAARLKRKVREWHSAYSRNQDLTLYHFYGFPSWWRMLAASSLWPCQRVTALSSSAGIFRSKDGWKVTLLMLLSSTW